MNPEFEHYLREYALESAREKPRKNKISALKKALMSGQFVEMPRQDEEVSAVRRIIMADQSVEEVEPASELNVGGLLRIARERKRITQRGLAFKAGIAPSTICRIERGVQPTLSVSGKIAVALKFSPEDALDILKAASKKPRQQT